MTVTWLDWFWQLYDRQYMYHTFNTYLLRALTNCARQLMGQLSWLTVMILLYGRFRSTCTTTGVDSLPCTMDEVGKWTRSSGATAAVAELGVR